MEQPTKFKKMKKREKSIVLRLTLDVEYDLNGESEVALKENLWAIPRAAASNGEFTEASAAEVVSWNSNVEKKEKHEKTVLVEFHNCAPLLYRVTSNKPITFSHIVKYFEEKEDFNEERDALTLLDGENITTINL